MPHSSLPTPHPPPLTPHPATLLLVCLLTATSARAEPSVDFRRDIRPLLSDRCFACHGPDAQNRQGELRLDMADEHRDRVVAPGRPDESELLRRVTSVDPELRMPPGEGDEARPLNAEQIALLRRWIADGAPQTTHWAYVPPVATAPPEVRDAQWPRNELDHYLLAAWERQGIGPAPDADRATLLRRLSFDLTGLPPTWDEVRAFVADERPEAYEEAVDRLLASDRYGERMAILWLDLVRYADTVGYHGDQEHHISPYRDWVLDAFNSNLPFDQFTREQLAGDLLPDADIDQRIATGYNRLLQTSHEGGVQAKEYLAIYAADRVRNLSGVWLGATIGCAQCHDHKFDPYTTVDFYSLAAFFADVDEASHLRKGSDATPTIRLPELSVHSRRERARLAELEAELRRLESTSESGSASDVAQPGAADERERRIAAVQTELERLRRAERKTMITVSIEPRTMRVLPRGNWLDDSGAEVEPAVPAFLGTLHLDRRATRLDLANWLTDAEQGAGGLVARVFVNRLWGQLFGAAIVRSVDDLGGQGELPSLPELLDALAIDFHEHGWDIKRTLKRMVMSRAYRQSSRRGAAARRVDPENRLFAGQTRRRLPAEMLRDQALAISGLLVLDYGGPSVRPYQPDGYYRHLNFPPRTYQSDQDARQWRRGVYMHWQRQFLHPMLRAFDAPSREECTGRRARSNTPLAALVMLNDPTFVEAARVFATHLLQGANAQTTAGDMSADDARLVDAWRRAVLREPDAAEVAALRTLLEDSRREFAAAPDGARKLVAIGLTPPPQDLDAAELAAWTSVCRVILNLDELLCRE